VFNVAKPEEIVPAIDAAKAAGAAGINFLASPLFAVPGGVRTRAVIERVTDLRLPSIFQWPEVTDQGGLLGYGPSFIQVFRQRARLVARVLRGSKPSEIPVEQPRTSSSRSTSRLPKRSVTRFLRALCYEPTG